MTERRMERNRNYELQEGQKRRIKISSEWFEDVITQIKQELTKFVFEYSEDPKYILFAYFRKYSIFNENDFVYIFLHNYQFSLFLFYIL